LFQASVAGAAKVVGAVSSEPISALGAKGAIRSFGVNFQNPVLLALVFMGKM
jgi:hypothetical protein